MRTTGRCFSHRVFISIFSIALVASSGAATTEGARASTDALAPSSSRSPVWQAKSRTSHQTEWISVRYATNPATGNIRATTNSYKEIGTGLNRLDPATGQWVESREEIELTPDGAIARQGAHQASFSANLNVAGAIQLVTSDGKLLSSHVIGLAYTDAASGESILIAGVKDTIGEVAGNQVIYRDAFDGPFKADVRYTYTKGGFEQDVIMRESPPPPEKYGFDSASARLEVWSEFLSPPVPVKTDAVLKRETDLAARQVMVDPDLTDETLDFGAMRIGSGTAFPLAQGANASERIDVPVGKNWLRIEGRDFLIEKVDYRDVAPSLETLPVPDEQQPPAGPKQAAVRPQPRRELLAALKPPARQQAKLKAADTPMRMAAVSTPAKGFVIDYSAVATQPNMTFQGDTTYYVSSSVNLSGTTTIEGGAVVKFTTGSALNIVGPVDCRTDAYRPAYFTAKDDDSVGESIAGSTGTPSGYYAAYLLRFNDSTTSYDLHNLRLRHGNQAIYRSVGSSATLVTLRHSQVQGCSIAFANFSTALNLRNVLVHRTLTGFHSSGLAPVGEHCTFHLVGKLLNYANHPPAQLKNTLLISCTNNVLYVADSTVIKPPTLDDAGIFQTAGLGQHYLAASSPYRAAGTPNINAALLTELKQTTTWPPVPLGGTIAQNTIFGPAVARNSTTATAPNNPDIGYAYAAMDYLAQNLLVQGAAGAPATLLVTNGAVIGVHTLAGGNALQFGAYSELISVGTPDKLNRFVPLQIVQENGPASVSQPANFTLLHGAGLSPYPNARFSFTDLSIPAGPYRHMAFWSGGFIKLSVQDSQVRGGELYLGPDTGNHSIGLTNTLWQRVKFAFHPYGPASFQAWNNLFKGGALLMDMSPPGSPAWTFRDNLFDGTIITQSGGAVTDNNWNAYVTALTATRLTPAVSAPNNHDVLLSASPAYDVGPFGSNYLPASATSLINQGSRTAASAGLFHHTTSKIVATREAATQVDIGLHYAAVGSDGKPLDSDTDDIPDYLEDKNGNGTTDTGETSFTNADTDGDLLSDGFEVNLALTNPLVTDTGNTGVSDGNKDPDGDGLTNLDEFVFGFDPLSNQHPGPANRQNYSYDLLDRLIGVTGKGPVLITPDKEGNIRVVTPQP